MKIILGSDHGGFELKKTIIQQIEAWGYEWEDVGCHSDESVDYPDYAVSVAQKISQGKGEVGILICGTGIGMSMAANKMDGIRCAVVSDEFSARMSREHNQANVLAIGARVVGPDLAKSIVDTFLHSTFRGGRHQRRVDKVNAISQSHSV